MKPVIRSISVRGVDRCGGSTRTISTGDDVVFELEFDSGGAELTYAAVGINSLLGERVCTVGTHLSSGVELHARGTGALQCRLPDLPLVAGEYSVVVAVGRRTPPRDVDRIEDALRFRVEPSNYFGTGAAPLPGQGYLAQRSEWRMVSASGAQPRVMRL
jgi:hypothetical protein